MTNGIGSASTTSARSARATIIAGDVTASVAIQITVTDKATPQTNR